MGEHFTKPKSLGGNVKFETVLPNYAAKTELKNTTGVDTSKCPKEIDLTSLKSDIDKLEKATTGLNSLKRKVDKLNVDKFLPVPVDLSKLRNIVKVAITQRLMKLKRKLLIMNMINILRHKDLIS